MKNTHPLLTFLWLPLLLCSFSAAVFLTMDVPETKSFIANNGAGFDTFGHAVDISGDYAIAGATRFDNPPSFNQGAAFVFHRENGEWTQQTKLFDPAGVPNEDYGHSVGIDGDYAIVGAYENSYVADTVGKAYIYKRDGSDWLLEDTLTASDRETDSWFGYSVAISGGYAIVGARYHDTNGNFQQGKAYIFHRNGTDWVEQDQLIAEDGVGEMGAPRDEFGYSVDIFNDYAVVGAVWADPNGSNSGKIYVYHRSGSDWQQQAALATGNAGDEFGTDVGISENYVIAGAPRHDPNGNNDQGMAYIFERNGATWNTTPQFLHTSDGVAGDAYGTSVAIHNNFAIVGANHHATGGDADRGKAYIFKLENGTWSEVSRPFSSDGASGDQFGVGIGISATDAIVGARNFDVGGNANQGKAYVYALPVTSLCEDSTLTLTDPILDEQQRYAIAYINASNEIGPMADVTYVAKDSIDLKAGFEVQPGGLFHALMGDCSLLLQAAFSEK